MTSDIWTVYLLYTLRLQFYFYFTFTQRKNSRRPNGELKYNGNSVIDYAATSIQLHDSVKSFKVLPFTPYSDHKPIEVCLAISNDIGKLEPACLNPDLLDDQPTGYKWAQAAKDAPNAFLKEQSQEDIRKLAETILNKETTTKEEVIDLMHCAQHDQSLYFHY